MMPSIFPKEIIEHSTEHNFSKHSTKSKTIYSGVVCFVIGSLFLLPFIHVDVGVRSQGIIRPVSEVNQVMSIVSGRIEILPFGNNDHVHKGQLIAQISSPVINERKSFNELRTGQITLYQSDLKVLLEIDSADVFQTPELQTSRYLLSYHEFLHRLRNAFQQIEVAENEYERNRLLAERNFVSRSVYEDHLLALQVLRNDYRLFIDQQKNHWKAEQVSFEEELDRLSAERKELGKERELYLVRSPASGSIHNMSGISVGSFISPNQILAEITPDTSLIAEVYISPDDIGLIHEEMSVRFQVSAYNYNQWGILEGDVKDISHDVILMDGRPVFRVRCYLNQNYLSLNNGYKGYMKKGMTLQARFIVSRRSLYQLLYDKMDDWLNPAWNENQYTTHHFSG